MEVKHPVSLLQELMAQQHRDLPRYEIADLSTPGTPTFCCTVRVGGITATAAAIAKQIAKKEAALIALHQLGYSKSDGAVTSVLSKDNKTVTDEVVLTATLTYNAVGKLNEFTARKRLPYPTYDECGVNRHGDFIICCSLKEDTSKGCAPTKKVAKQLAAHYMLKLLEAKKLVANVPQLPVNPGVHVMSDDIIVHKFNELSINGTKPVLQKKTLLPRISIPKPDIVQEPNNISEQNSVVKEEEVWTVERLYAELKTLNVNYSIDIIKRSPCVLLLKFDNEENTTVVDTGNSYQEAYFNILQRAVKVTSTWPHYRDITEEE